MAKTSHFWLDVLHWLLLGWDNFIGISPEDSNIKTPWKSARSRDWSTIFETITYAIYKMTILLLKLSNFDVKMKFLQTCPVAINMAATIFAACAFHPPIVQLIDEPFWSFVIDKFTKESTSVLSILWTTDADMIASDITDFPRPSIL